MYSIYIIRLLLSISLVVSQMDTYSQNPNGEMYFKLHDCGVPVSFYINKKSNDSFYKDSTSKYYFYISVHRPTGTKKFSKNVFNTIHKNLECVVFDYHWALGLDLFIVKKHNQRNDTMVVNLTNVMERTFFLNIKFKKGLYTFSLNDNYKGETIDQKQLKKIKNKIN